MLPLTWNVLISIFVFAGPATASPPATVEGPRLRCIDQSAQRLVREGLRRSPTIRALAAQIEDTDLLVFVRVQPEPPHRSGSTRLLTVAAGTRFILVTIDPVAPRVDLFPRLGHELQHVVEIAAAPGVQNDEGIRSLFARIGFPASRDSWETDAAIATGRRVLEDLSREPPRAATVARR